jgi:peptide/nickel transport system substrate-binding protein
VRQAIAYAIDKDTIVETIFGGYALRADGLLPNGPFHSPNLEAYSYNPDKARELLAAAGWDPNREIEVLYHYTDQVTADLMAVLQAQLADVGIKMNYRLLSGDLASAMAIPEDPKGKSAVTWDLYYGARAAMVMQEYFNDYAIGKASLDQYPGSPEMDALIAAANGTVDPDEQKKALMALDEAINANVTTIPLYYQPWQVVESSRLHRNGEPYGNEQYNYNWGVQNWTIDPDAEGRKVLYTNYGPVDNYFIVPWLDPGIRPGSKMVFDHLLSANGDLSAIAGGALAETWTVSPDGLTVSFTLRDGIMWHDGSPITAADIAWSIEAALKYPTVHGVMASTFNAIAGAADFKAGTAEHVSGISTDGKTITLAMSKVDPNVLITFSQFPPLPSSYFEGVDPTLLQQDPFWQKPIGSGPFMVEDAKFGEYASFVAYDGYWAGRPKIDQVVAFAGGDGDPNLVKNVLANRFDYGLLKAVPDMVALKDIPGLTITQLDVPYTRMIWINQYDK